MNPGVQMDVDEFFNVLCDKLENTIRAQGKEAKEVIDGLSNVVSLVQAEIFQEFFGGKIAHQIISKECEHVSEREEPFLALQVEIKKNLYESLDLFVEGDLLEGENKYASADSFLFILLGICVKDARRKWMQLSVAA